MTIFHDVTFATRLGASRLDAFKSKGNNHFNFRCPLCGDSKKNLRKARGYLFPGKNQFSDTLFFKCYNCNESMSFDKFLAKVDSSLHQEYRFGRFRDAMSGSANTVRMTDSEIPKNDAPNVLSDNEEFGRFFVKIKTLAKSHFAYKYLIQDRKSTRNSSHEWISRMPSSA